MEETAGSFAYVLTFQVSSGNRSSRFLFDAIFGLEVPLLEDQSVEDDEEDTNVQKCSCGKYRKCSWHVCVVEMNQHTLAGFIHSDR